MNTSRYCNRHMMWLIAGLFLSIGLIGGVSVAFLPLSAPFLFGIALGAWYEARYNAPGPGESGFH